MPLDLKRYKSILCLHGALPLAWLKKQSSLPIIAADGAANDLVAAGIHPAMIIGDCDSVHPELLKRYPHRRIRDQNSTDFEKAIQYCESERLTPVVVAGMNGGFLDQVVANIGVFSRIDALFFSEDLMGWTATGKHQLDLPVDTKVSLFGCPQAVVTTEGFRWELKQSTLVFGGFCSSSNRVQTSPVRLHVQEGKILGFAYRDPIVDAGSLKNKE